MKIREICGLRHVGANKKSKQVFVVDSVGVIVAEYWTQWSSSGGISRFFRFRRSSRTGYCCSSSCDGRSFPGRDQKFNFIKFSLVLQVLGWIIAATTPFLFFNAGVMYNAEVRSDVVAVRFYHFHAWQQIIWWRSFNSLLKAASKQVSICVLFVLSVSPRAHQGHQTKEKNLMTANGMKWMMRLHRTPTRTKLSERRLGSIFFSTVTFSRVTIENRWPLYITLLKKINS